MAAVSTDQSVNLYSCLNDTAFPRKADNAVSNPAANRKILLGLFEQSNFQILGKALNWRLNDS
jgi:hypothetical protein